MDFMGHLLITLLVYFDPIVTNVCLALAYK
jgi:hypothetical protein